MEQKLIDDLKEHSEKTMIPAIRILEKALETYLSKEKKKNGR